MRRLHRGGGSWLLAAGAALGAQSLTYSRGQNVSPAFEGWERIADGSSYFLFGYMNRNWEEEIDVPVGPDNSFSPAAPIRGSRRTSCRAATASCSASRAEGLRREGRTGLDADHQGQDREGVRTPRPRLHRRRRGEGVGNRRARRRHSSPEVRANKRADARGAGPEAPDREGGRAADACRDRRPTTAFRRRARRARAQRSRNAGSSTTLSAANRAQLEAVRPAA